MTKPDDWHRRHCDLINQDKRPPPKFWVAHMFELIWIVWFVCFCVVVWNRS